MIAAHAVRGAFRCADGARLIDAVGEAAPHDAGLVRECRDHNLRRADPAWLDEVPGTNRVIDLVRDANRGVFHFDVTEFAESAQVARYSADREGHFDWISDIGEGRLAERRKLIVVVQLSDPVAFVGGIWTCSPSAATGRPFADPVSPRTEPLRHCGIEPPGHGAHLLARET